MNWVTIKIQRAWNAVGSRLKASFYLYLAVVFTFVVLADSFVLNVTAKMRQTSFDLMIRNRLVVAPPDPDIVIVDINEASLAAMAAEYGRWPWPRLVMGEFLEGIERQNPKAVVFDVLFSDPDVFNPDSDAYFNDAVAATDNTFFPMLRLDPDSDSLSEFTADRIPGARPLAGQEAKPASPIAVVLPFFDAAMQGGRIGTHNIYPDVDGVSRQYTVYRDEHGWLVPSLPARVVEWMGIESPMKDSVLINWRGKPFTYRYVGFADVYFDMQNRESKRPKDEFKGKIVLIGSTAAGLFDVKATPMDRLFPGVEILATAIDNLKNDDYLRVPDMKFVNLLLALLIVWATAAAFYRNMGQEMVDKLFGASQFMLIAVSYASINLLTTYINLTGPVMLGVAYFSCARVYASSARKALEKSAVMSTIATEGEQYAALTVIRIRSGQDAAGEKAVARLRKGLVKRVVHAKSVEVLKGAQKGIWGLFEGMVVVSWTCIAADEAEITLVREEAKKVEAAAVELWRASGGKPEGVECIYHEGRIEGGGHARAGWAALFGEALMRWGAAGKE